MKPIEETLLRRLMTPQDKNPLDVYDRASFNNEDWYNSMVNHMWMPAYPVLQNAGREGSAQQLMPCFPKGTPVMTNTGSQPIEKVKPGTLVLTHEGRFQPVTQIMQRQTDELLTIQPKMQPNFTCTSDHPILTTKGWKEASIANNVAHGFYKLTGTKTELQVWSKRFNEKIVPQTLKLDNDLMWLLGLWFADGSLNTSKYIIQWSIGNKNTKLQAHVKTLIRKIFKCEPREDFEPGAKMVQVLSSLLCTCFLKEFQHRPGKGQKKLPTWINELSPEQVKQFISGFLEGDGHKDKNGRITFVQSSLSLSLQLKLLLASINIITAWSQSIIDVEYLAYRQAFSEVTTNTPFREKKENHWFTNIEPCINKKEVQGSYKVYNLEVAKDNTYIVGTSIVHNCFTLGVEDNLESIMHTLFRSGVIFKLGGSTGINFSPIRSKGATLSRGGEAAGPIAFMKMFNAAAEAITQGGKRRGGFMIVLDANHDDIFDFISCKAEEGTLSNMNISVRLNPDDELVDTYKTGVIKAIAENIHKTGEPGVLFGDAIKPYDCVNLCGEVPLPPWGVCNLGSVNLAQCVEGREFDWDQLKQSTLELGKYLDYLIDVNFYPFELMKEEALKTRRLGVGVMGWHECLSKLNMQYDDVDVLQLAQDIGKIMNDNLTAEFPHASQHMSIAPTGTISLLCNTSPGIEPIYQKEYEIYSPQGNLTMKFDINDKTSTELGWGVHVAMQAAWQHHIDGAISKTVLMPFNSKVNEIVECITRAEELNCKGLTIYRVGSRVNEAMTSKPVITQGNTLRVKTGAGKLFTTLNTINNQPYEVFIAIGRSGSLTQSFTEAIGRLISLSLQQGIPITEIIDQLQGLHSQHQMHDVTIGTITSIPDGIAKSLGYLKELNNIPGNIPPSKEMGECPECHHTTIITEGCETCTNCGWNKCGT